VLGKITAVLVAMLALTPAAGRTETMRCDGGLVSIGSTAGETLKKCGEPTYAAKREDTRATLDPLTGEKRHSSIAIDDWTYNFGPNRFQYRVVLENGVVARIESLDKGY